MIAVLADTHLPRGERRLPDAALRLLSKASAIIHAGDFTRASVLDELVRLAPVAAVHGNVDEPLLRERLPSRLEVEAEGLRIGIVHVPGAAAGRHARLQRWFPECDAVVYGHTHAPEIARLADTWILNPGSPTERRRAARHTMIVIRDRKPTLVSL
jgi:putative phosphoesterase